MSVDRLVRTFLHSPEFRQKRATLTDAAAETVEIDCGGFRILVSPPDSAIGLEICRTHAYEPAVAETLQQVLSPGMTFVDAGCNIGFFSLLACHCLAGDGRVEAFDPNPRNCDLLKQSVELNGFSAIRIHCAALADEAHPYVYEDVDGNGFIRTLRADEDESSAQVVPGRRLDEALEDVSRVDVIKIDTEGAEGLVLRGASGLLSRDHPVILLEFSPAALRQVSRMEPLEMLGALEALGYTFRVLDRHAKRDETLSGTQVLEAAEASGRDHLDLFCAPTSRA